MNAANRSEPAWFQWPSRGRNWARISEGRRPAKASPPSRNAAPMARAKSSDSRLGHDGACAGSSRLARSGMWTTSARELPLGEHAGDVGDQPIVRRVAVVEALGLPLVGTGAEGMPRASQEERPQRARDLPRPVALEGAFERLATEDVAGMGREERPRLVERLRVRRRVPVRGPAEEGMVAEAVVPDGELAAEVAAEDGEHDAVELIILGRDEPRQHAPPVRQPRAADGEVEQLDRLALLACQVLGAVGPVLAEVLLGRERVAEDGDPPDVRPRPLRHEVVAVGEPLRVAAAHADVLEAAVRAAEESRGRRRQPIAADRVELPRPARVLEEPERSVPPREPGDGRGDDFESNIKND